MPDAPQDTGEPIAELAEFVAPTPTGFMERVRQRIERRQIGSQLLALSWYGAGAVVIEFLRFFFEPFNSGKKGRSVVTEKLLQSLRGLADQAVVAIPKIFTGLVLLVVAIIVAKIIEWVLRAMLTRVKVDKLIEKAGIDKTLARIGIRQQLNLFVPRLVYFLLLLLFARTAADVLGLTAVSHALGSLFAYLPNLVAALMLLLIGSAAAQFIGQMVAQAAEESGVDFGAALGRMVSGMIMFVIAIMAISQLKIDTDMVRIVTSFALAGFAVAFGLSFGLGSRDLMRNIMAGFYARKLFRPGQQITIAGESGVLRAITATHTLVDGADDTLTIANAAILEHVSRQPKDEI